MTITRTGLSPALARLSHALPVVSQRPLAWSAFARHYNGVSVDVLSSGY